MKKTLKTLTVVAAFSIGLASCVSADVIYDSFDYTDGPVGQTGDVGFDGGYVGIAADANNPNPFGTITGLNFTDTNGNRLVTGGSAIGRPARAGRFSINADVTTAASTLTGDNSTMWFSFLYEIPANTIDTSVVLSSTGQSSGGAHELNVVEDVPNFGVGVVIEDSGAFNAPFSAAVYNDAITNTGGNSGATTGEIFSGTQFVAAQVNWNPEGTQDELFVYLVDDLSVQPLESDAVASTLFSFSAEQQASLDILSVTDTQTVSVDEVRFGTTFASVAPFTAAVPEPSSLALLSLLGSVLAIRRKR